MHYVSACPADVVAPHPPPAFAADDSQLLADSETGQWECRPADGAAELVLRRQACRADGEWPGDRSGKSSLRTIRRSFAREEMRVDRRTIHVMPGGRIVRNDELPKEGYK